MFDPNTFCAMIKFDVTFTFDEKDAFPRFDRVFDPITLATTVKFDVMTTFDKNDAFA